MTDKQIAMQTVAEMLDQAKMLLKEAEIITNENNIDFCYQNFYEQVTGEYPDWNSSNCY